MFPYKYKYIFFKYNQRYMQSEPKHKNRVTYKVEISVEYALEMLNYELYEEEGAEED